MEDSIFMQEVVKSFTYSWLMILITFVGWMEPTHYKGMEVDTINIFHGAQYKNLWVFNDKERQSDNNIMFYLYLDALRDAVVKIP